MPIRIAFDLGDEIRVSPPICPDHKLNLDPGDLSKFVPQGNGVYGYQPSATAHPFAGAPRQDENGGIIYFGNQIAREDLEALCRILGLSLKNREGNKDYSVFIAASDHPEQDGFLRQIRIVSKFGLSSLFGALNDTEYNHFVNQKLTVQEAFWTFIEQEKNCWGTSFMKDEEKGLQGLFGGDGDFAREELSFGLMVENSYFGVFRLWSRAWLVTK